MKQVHDVVIALTTILLAIIITIPIVVNQPVGHWYYMTVDQRWWWSIGAGSITFLWVLVFTILVWVLNRHS